MNGSTHSLTWPDAKCCSNGCPSKCPLHEVQTKSRAFSTVNCDPSDAQDEKDSQEKGRDISTDTPLIPLKDLDKGLKAESVVSVHRLYETLDEEEEELKPSLVKLVWKDVTYTLKVTSVRCQKKPFPWIRLVRKSQAILKKQSGSIGTGSLTGVIGPSGAGKSTLLQCLAGLKRQNLKGEVYVTYSMGDFCPKLLNGNNNGNGVKLNGKLERNGGHADGKSFNKLNVAFIGQQDNLIGVLTVRESLMFASRLKNYGQEKKIREIKKHLSLESLGAIKLETNNYHIFVVNKVMGDLGLESCAETVVAKCSGGQMKRLSFALELISRPKLMILDEPTSGLDSSSAYQCVQFLKKLTSPKSEKGDVPLGIVASIHQPSASLLQLFHNLYILSKEGQCIYNGPTSKLVAHLNSFGLNCPQFHNPADFVTEVASGDYGQDSLDKLIGWENERQSKESLATSEADESQDKDMRTERVNITTVVDRMVGQRFPTCLHTQLLLKRTMMSTLREPMLTWLRLAQHLAMALVGSFMYNYSIGEPSGCFSELTQDISSSFNMSSTGHSIEKLQQEMFKQRAVASDNAAFLFFSLLFLAFANTMPVVLTFPLEMSVFVKERRNAWYGCGTYYLAKLVADTPFQVVIPLAFCAISWPATGQVADFWRFFFFCLISVLVSSISQGIGILFGIIFLNNISAAVFMAPLTLTPFFLLGGFFVTYSGVSMLLKPITILSYIRYAFESFIVVIYGFGRCPRSMPASDLALGGKKAKFLAKMACMLAEPKGNASDGISEAISSFTENGISSKDAEWLSPFLDVNETCLRYVLEGVENVMSTFQEEDDNNATAGGLLSAINGTGITEDGLVTDSTSYMLSHWELTEAVLWQNLAILVLILVSLRVGAYLILVVKTNRKLKEY